jgi:D-alanyl-D-alanine endopeptidase (penicillin-binding protein 7)
MRRHVRVVINMPALILLVLFLSNPSGSAAADNPTDNDSKATLLSAPARPKTAGIPKLKCVSAIVVDNTSNRVLYQKDCDSKRPIASITKLLAAIVLAESNFDLEKKVMIAIEDSLYGTQSKLKVGEIFYAKDLFYAALISSDNRAIMALARNCGLDYHEFIEKMNAKAKKLGLDSTSVVDPTGAFKSDISTARDCAKLLNRALKYPIIKSALTCRLYKFRSINHKRLIYTSNTNRMLNSQWEVAGGKTGYNSSSGHCLAVRLADGRGGDITTVVLASPSNGYRFSDTKKLADWAFEILNNQLAEGGD